MSDENKKRFDVREVLKPWHDTIRTVYYLIAIGTAVYFGGAYLLRNAVIPYWPYVDCIISFVLLATLSVAHSRRAKRLLAHHDSQTYAFIVSGPTFLTALAVHAAANVYGQPPAETRLLWAFIFGIAVVSIPIALMDATVWLISRLAVAVLEMIDRIVDVQNHVATTHSDDIRGIIKVLEKMVGIRPNGATEPQARIPPPAES